MKVAILSYPMLFQSAGGLQIQILETVAALQRRGVDARLVNPVQERLSDFDLTHVFAILNGNQRAVEWAAAQRKPIVLSPLLRPNWTANFAKRAALGDWIVSRLTGWEVKSEYRHLKSGISQATRCVALGTIEKQCLREAFGVPESRCDVIPNGIPSRFFSADPKPFLEKFGLQPGFVLCAASINSHKNQLGLVKAVAPLGIPVVLAGHCQPIDEAYLAAAKSFPNVHYVGSLPYDGPLLASAYAAAGVFCLPSMSEVMPLTVMEALAAGTPAVMTKHHCMDLQGMSKIVAEVEPTDADQIRNAIRQLLANAPSGAACSSAVEHLTWDAVATQLQRTYKAALGAR
ncbi:MAG TPA: glycosyltransferase family 4 protein [Aquabacterium sp.]|nr:glycosyltransferase family 4 protein [Aquabacterium sp.]